MKDIPSFMDLKIENPISIKGVETLPIKPNGLPAEVELILNSRIGNEYEAHFFYKNASNWCSNVGYSNAAQFFDDEAKTELSHANKIQKYLIDWNHHPIIPQTETNIEFESLIDIINKAYVIEYNLLEKYSNDQSEFLRLHPASFNFIQKYVNIQNQSVKEYSDLLNVLNLIDTSNKLDLLIFEQNYFNIG